MNASDYKKGFYHYLLRIGKSDREAKRRKTVGDTFGEVGEVAGVDSGDGEFGRFVGLGVEFAGFLGKI